ncbi:hypothetical protein [Methylobacterium sp. A54F]
MPKSRAPRRSQPHLAPDAGPPPAQADVERAIADVLERLRPRVAPAKPGADKPAPAKAAGRQAGRGQARKVAGAGTPDE